MKHNVFDKDKILNRKNGICSMVATYEERGENAALLFPNIPRDRLIIEPAQPCRTSLLLTITHNDQALNLLTESFNGSMCTSKSKGRKQLFVISPFSVSVPSNRLIKLLDVW